MAILRLFYDIENKICKYLFIKLDNKHLIFLPDCEKRPQKRFFLGKNSKFSHFSHFSTSSILRQKRLLPDNTFCAIFTPNFKLIFSLKKKQNPSKPTKEF